MLKELWFEKNLVLYMEYFKRDRKSFTRIRWMLAIVILTLFTSIFFLLNEPMLLLSMPIVLLIGFKIPYLSMLLKKKNQDLIITFAFPQFLRYFIVLLHSSGNVYQTLKATSYYIDDPIKSELEKLILKIEHNNERNAYMEFANFIGTSESLMIMDMIYEFSNYGIKKESIKELESFVVKLQENKVNELISKKVLDMERYALPSLFISIGFVLSFAAVLFIYYAQQISGNLQFLN